mgnify:FL=1
MYDLVIYFDGDNPDHDFVTEIKSPVVPIVGNDMMIVYDGHLYWGDITNITYDFKEEGEFCINVAVKES